MISRVCCTASRSNVVYCGVRLSSSITPTNAPTTKERPVLKKFKDVIDNREEAKALSPDEQRAVGMYKAQRVRELTRRSRKTLPLSPTPCTHFFHIHLTFSFVIIISKCTHFFSLQSYHKHTHTLLPTPKYTETTT